MLPFPSKVQDAFRSCWAPAGCRRPTSVTSENGYNILLHIILGVSVQTQHHSYYIMAELVVALLATVFGEYRFIILNDPDRFR